VEDIWQARLEHVGQEEKELIQKLREDLPLVGEGQFQVSLEDVWKIFNKNAWPREVDGITKEEGAPFISFFVGAQPGAGKSLQLKKIEEEKEGNVITIDGDHYRTFHPFIEDLRGLGGSEYVGNTAQFSSTILRFMIARGLDNSFNMTIEGTMRDSDVVKGTISMCKRNEYDVEIRLVAVSNLASYIGTHYRYERMLETGTTVARATRDEIHSASYRNIPVLLENLMYPKEEERLVNTVKIFNREGGYYISCFVFRRKRSF